MLFICPSLGGCHLPLYMSYTHLIRAKNINDAKKYMIEYIEESGTDTVFFVSKIKKVKESDYFIINEEYETCFNEKKDGEKRWMI